MADDNNGFDPKDFAAVEAVDAAGEKGCDGRAPFRDMSGILHFKPAPRPSTDRDYDAAQVLKLMVETKLMEAAEAMDKALAAGFNVAWAGVVLKPNGKFEFVDVHLFKRF